MILKTSILLDRFAEQVFSNAEGAVWLAAMQSDFLLKGI